MKFIYSGSYGLIVAPDYIREFDGVLVLRMRATRMPEAYVQETFSLIGETYISIHCYTPVGSGTC